MPAINNKRIQAIQASTQRGFILLPVVLSIALVAAIAYLMNVDGAMNVNSLGKEIESGEARFVAMAGMNHMLWQANKSNCTGFTNITNAAIGTNSYSATITPTSGSPVSISVTGSHANGASYTINRDRVKVYQSPKNVTLQLGTTPGKDALIASGNPTTNYGNGDGGVLNAFIAFRHQLIQFALSSIPLAANIRSAQLQMYQKYAVGTTNIDLYRVKQSWVEGTMNGSGTADGATWNTYNGSNAWLTNGGDYDATAIASTSVTDGSNVARSWEIASLVQDWLTGKYLNNGMQLKAAGGVTVTFASKEDTTAANRPKLTVNYACECGQSCASPLITTTLNPVADAFIDNQAASKNYGASTSLIITFVKANDQKRIILRFDTSGIPNGALIQSAKLRLRVSSVNSATNNPKSVSAYALTQSWVEGTDTGTGTPINGATWNTWNGSTAWTTAGGTYRTPSVAMAVEETSGISPPPGSFSTGWLYWDLAALTQEWVDGVTVNNGVILISTVKDEQSMDSKEKGGSTIPQLVITYTPP